jgi:hypothetical protein
MSIDELDGDSREATKQYVFWTAVVLVFGFVVFVVL